jgi:hypothetical protein
VIAEVGIAVWAVPELGTESVSVGVAAATMLSVIPLPQAEATARLFASAVALTYHQ